MSSKPEYDINSKQWLKNDKPINSTEPENSTLLNCLSRSKPVSFSPELQQVRLSDFITYMSNSQPPAWQHQKNLSGWTARHFAVVLSYAFVLSSLELEILLFRKYNIWSLGCCINYRQQIYKELHIPSGNPGKNFMQTLVLPCNRQWTTL